MLFQIRRKVFETNSSSTHSICITENRRPLIYPSKLRFKCEEFGWEGAVLRTPEEKASYLYASILAFFNKEEAETKKNQLYAELGEEGIECEFDQPEYSVGGYCLNAYVDHVGNGDHGKFIFAVLSNRRRLFRYLFNDESFVLTDNDNGGWFAPYIRVDYDHEEYYKGN